MEPKLPARNFISLHEHGSDSRVDQNIFGMFETELESGPNVTLLIDGELLDNSDQVVHDKFRKCRLPSKPKDQVVSITGTRYYFSVQKISSIECLSLCYLFLTNAQMIDIPQAWTT